MTTPSTDWKEVVPEGEDARLLAIAEQLRGVQRRRAAKGPTMRGLHAKSHANGLATFTVNGDLPAHARHGLFATPGTHRALVRFSNGAGHHQSDRAGDIRGLAIKVLDVPGKKLIPGLEDAFTQDFLTIHTPSTPFSDAHDFVALMDAAAGNPLLLLPRYAGAVGFGKALRLLGALGKAIRAPFTTFAGRRMYSGAAIRVGPYAARYALLPIGEHAPTAAGSSLMDDLAARLAEGALGWDFALQFYVDEARTPIEDASAVWKEEDAPFIVVGRLEVQKQDIRSERGRARNDALEKLSFDPWHALIDHRPLGHVMRARNHAYRLSTLERGAAPEPALGEVY